MQICTSPQTDNHASIPLVIFTGWMPNQQRQSTEGSCFSNKVNTAEYIKQTSAIKTIDLPCHTISQSLLNVQDNHMSNAYLNENVSVYYCCEYVFFIIFGP